MNLLDNAAKIYSVIGVFTSTNFVVNYNGTSSCKFFSGREVDTYGAMRSCVGPCAINHNALQKVLYMDH